MAASNTEALKGLPVLEGFRTFPGAARYLGYTRSRISQMVQEGKLCGLQIEDSAIGLVTVESLERERKRLATLAQARAEALSR